MHHTNYMAIASVIAFSTGAHAGEHSLLFIHLHEFIDFYNFLIAIDT